MFTLSPKNPFTGEVFKSYPVRDIESVKVELLSLKEEQKKWLEVPLKNRVELIKEGLTYFENNKNLVASDLSAQMGRPLSQCSGEIAGLLQRANYMIEIAEKTLAPDLIEESPQFYRAIQHVPLGTIFVISAWNYPLLITINSVIPALLAGNTVLLKHSSITPEIGVHFERAFGALGEYKNLLTAIVVDHKTTGEIIENLEVDHVIFTGSVSGGEQILKHCSNRRAHPRFIMPQLELGGKDAAFVNADADLSLAAETVVDGAMFNSGQSCCGIERAYVHETIYDSFIEKAKSLIAEYRLGDPVINSTNLGPQANAKSVDVMLDQIKSAIANGAKVITGGEDVIIKKGRFLKPTLLVNVGQTMEINKKENFGPVLPILKVKDVSEAIELINDSDYGLTASIFTKDVGLAVRFANKVNTGTVFMNRCDYLDPALPWTGVKDSGWGSSLSKYGFYGVTRRKAIHFKK